MEIDENVEKDFKKAAQLILLRDIMISPVRKIAENEKFFLIERKFREHDIKHLPVVDSKDHLVGVITMADLHRTVSPRKDLSTGNFFYDPAQFEMFQLKDHMTRNPFSLSPLNNFVDALMAMAKGGYGCIPILDEDKTVLGIITQSDLIKRVTKMLENLSTEVALDKKNGSNSVGRLVHQTPLKLVMSYPPIVMREDDEFALVEQTLRQSRIKHLPIVNMFGKLAGIITLSDLYRITAPKKREENGETYYEKEHLNKFILKYSMTKHPSTLTPDHSIFNAMEKMVYGNFGCVIVTDLNQMITGIVTQTDIVKIISKLL